MDVLVLLLIVVAAYVGYRKWWPVLSSGQSKQPIKPQWVRPFALFYLAVEMSYSVSEVPDSIQNAYKGYIAPYDQQSILVRLELYLNYNLQRSRKESDYMHSVNDIIALTRLIVDNVCAPQAPREYIRAKYFRESGTEIEESYLDLQIQEMEEAVRVNPSISAKLQQLFVKEIVDRTFEKIHGASVWDYQELIAPRDI